MVQNGLPKSIESRVVSCVNFKYFDVKKTAIYKYSIKIFAGRSRLGGSWVAHKTEDHRWPHTNTTTVGTHRDQDSSPPTEMETEVQNPHFILPTRSPRESWQFKLTNMNELILVKLKRGAFCHCNLHGLYFMHQTSSSSESMYTELL